MLLTIKAEAVRHTCMVARIFAFSITHTVQMRWQLEKLVARSWFLHRLSQPALKNALVSDSGSICTADWTSHASKISGTKAPPSPHREGPATPVRVAIRKVVHARSGDIHTTVLCWQSLKIHSRVLGDIYPTEGLWATSFSIPCLSHCVWDCEYTKNHTGIQWSLL